MIEDGSCIFPHTIQEHKKNIHEKLMEQCFPEGTFQWQMWTHSHIAVKFLFLSCQINGNI